jgi:ABC-type nitrate/sulfonate/bicarbonate transport system substrate-binding protein
VNPRAAFGALLFAVLACVSIDGRAADPITIARTESVGSLPIRIATQRGWWARVGLAPRFVVFPSELPLMSSAGVKAWDIAVVGIGVAVLGAARYDTTVIGATADRSRDVAVFAGGLDAASATAQLRSLPVLANRGTTAYLTAVACLDTLGIGAAAPAPRDRQPGDVARALANGDPILGAVPSPYIDAVRRSGRARLLCSASDAGLVVTDDVVVRHAFLEEAGDVATRALATIIRAIAWLQANPEAARELLPAEDAGDPGTLRRQVAAITFDLDRMIRIFATGADGSQIHRWHDRVAGIQRHAGDVREAPFASGYIDGSVLARIAADPKLRAFATLADRPE